MSKFEELKSKLLPFVRSHAIVALKEPIRLSSGKMSTEYFDGRRVTLHPEGMTLFAHTLLELIDPSKFDAVGGPSLGADPIATAISILAYLEKGIILPAFLVRKEPKKYGLQKLIEGTELKPGMKVLIVEDVLTTGSSALQAIRAVEETGARVNCVTCLLDRKEGASETLKAYQFKSIFTKDDFASPSSTPAVKHDKSKSEFFVESEGGKAFLSYTKKGNVLDFYHTFVPEALRGQGLAEQIVEAGFQYARQNNLKVFPSCPYILRWVAKHEEWRSLISGPGTE